MSKEQEEPKSNLKKGEYVISAEFLKKYVMTPDEIRKKYGL